VKHFAKAFIDLQLRFARKVAALSGLPLARADNLEQCFPFQVLSLEASAFEFYDFYGIQSPALRP
jgi:hypothetical protein